MLLQEWIDQKLQELKDQKYREVSFKSAKECKVARNTFSIMLFTANKVPLDAMVDVTKILGEEKVPGVMVDFQVIKPRKRKPEIEHFEIPLAN